ncbi:MAG TPA: TrkA family potassium uptake protein [Anaerolineales bacterium]|nr:TrkA family potassium uptake protein [Anaerolineales bacterium]
MFVIIVGGGNTGSYVARLLLDGGHTVKVVEERPAVLEKIKNELPSDIIITGDGSSPQVLEAAGVSKANVLAAVTGSDETNLVITSLARFEFNVPRVIARLNNPKNAWLFTPEMGVDVSLNQADILGRLVAEEMSLGDMMTLLKLRKGEYSLIEEKVHPLSPAAGKSLRDLQIPSECVIVAVIRKNQLLIPHGDTGLQPADEVLALVHASQLNSLAVMLGPKEPQVRS